MNPQDLYHGARPLARFTLLGEVFTVVRRRVENNSKRGYGPWRNYLELLHDGTPVGSSFFVQGSAQEGATTYENALRKLFTQYKDAGEILRKAIREIKTRA